MDSCWHIVVLHRCNSKIKECRFVLLFGSLTLRRLRKISSGLTLRKSTGTSGTSGVFYTMGNPAFFEFPINSCHSCWLNLMVKHLNLHYVFLFSYYVIIHISYSILLANLGWWSHLIFQPDWNHESATFSWTILFFVGISIEVCRHQDVVSSDLESVVLRDAVMSRAQLPRFWRP